MGRDYKWLSKKQFEIMKAKLEAKGFVVLSKYRKNMTSIKLGDIVLSEDKND